MISDVDFTEDLIDDKVDDEYIVPEGQILKIKLTAVCPYCGDDSIIGESSGFTITPEFLFEMKKRWC